MSKAAPAPAPAAIINGRQIFGDLVKKKVLNRVKILVTYGGKNGTIIIVKILGRKIVVYGERRILIKPINGKLPLSILKLTTGAKTYTKKSKIHGVKNGILMTITNGTLMKNGILKR